MVTADIHADGHDVLAATTPGASREAPARNPDGSGGERRLAAASRWTRSALQYRRSWIAVLPWRSELSKKFGAGQDVASELLEAARARDARAVGLAGRRGPPARPGIAGSWRRGPPRSPVARLRRGAWPGCRRARAAMGRTDRSRATASTRARRRRRARARGLARVRMFPGRRAPTVAQRVRGGGGAAAYIASMGFDVLYLPIHPIGRSFRKGPTIR